MVAAALLCVPELEPALLAAFGAADELVAMERLPCTLASAGGGFVSLVVTEEDRVLQVNLLAFDHDPDVVLPSPLSPFFSCMLLKLLRSHYVCSSIW